MNRLSIEKRVQVVSALVEAFVGAKRKNVNPEREADGWGDVWTWTALDADGPTLVLVCLGVEESRRHELV